MKKKFIWLIMSCLMVAALVLASCAAPVVEEKEVKGVVTEPEKKAEKVEEVVGEEGPKYGGILATFLSETATRWDPAGLVGGRFVSQAFEPLIMADWYRDPEEYPLSMKYDFLNEDLWIGMLAESWDWPDPLTISFKLREGVRWHNKPPANGREFVASDIKWHYERILADPKRSTRAIQNVDSITCPDKYTVVFKFKTPDVASLERIAVRNITISNRDVVEVHGDKAAEDWRYHIGTGPFMLEDYVSDSFAFYGRNPDYWGKDPEGKSLPYLDGLKILVIADKATQLAALRTGKADITFYEHPVAWHHKEGLETSNPDMQWAPSPDGGIFSLWMRADIEPFSDIRVRKALSMATNRQEMTEKLLGGSGVAVRYPALPGWACYTPIDELPEDIRETYVWSSSSIDKAKALLAEAGYPNGFKTVVQYQMAGTKYEPLDLELVMAYWAQIGVDLELRPVDAGTMSSLREIPFPFEEILGVGGAQAKPLDLVRSKWIIGSDCNRSRVTDPHIQEVYAAAIQEFDIVKRTAMLKELYVYLAGQYYSVTLPGINNWMAWQPWVKGYHGETTTCGYSVTPMYARIWIDKD